MKQIDKLFNKIKKRDQKALLLLGLALIVVALFGKLLLIMGILILVYVAYNIYTKNNKKKEKKKERKK